jgi:hypothetical protein
MIIIHHRRNSVAEINETSPEYGAEIDLRNHGDDIFVTHDPFCTDAVRLDEWLQAYKHRFLIANVKEEGLEPKVLSLFEQHGVGDFFILDESIPYIRKYAMLGLPKFAVRVSEFECVETALRLADYLKQNGRRIEWIWVDSFTGEPLAYEDAVRLREAGYKLCQVSPELHHVDDPVSWRPRIEAFLAKLDKLDLAPFRPDMVCTKLPELWR